MCVSTQHNECTGKVNTAHPKSIEITQRYVNNNVYCTKPTDIYDYEMDGDITQKSRLS